MNTEPKVSGVSCGVCFPCKNGMECAYSKNTDVQAILRETRAAARIEALTEALTLLPENYGPTLCGECNLVGDLCRECYANRRANKMKDEIQSKITSIREEV